MGISGLLNALKSIVNQVHVSEYKGLRVAVDAHCWLHRAGYSCSRELTEGIGTSKFVDFFMDLLDVLVKHDVIPVIVFDGRPLPAKALTNKTRRTSRRENAELAREAEADGRLGDAYSHYQKSVSGKFSSN
jgi:exonuclease 1